MNLIENFGQEIANAVEAYKTKVKVIPSQRKSDIKKLEAIFENTLPGLADYISAVEKFIEKLKTGIGIFQTGNSQLKTELMKVLNFYNDPAVKLLIKMEKENRYKKEWSFDYLEKLTQFIGFMKSSRESRKNFEISCNSRNGNRRNENTYYENLASARY